MLPTSLSLLLLAISSLASAHTIITYPGWRGNNLRTTPDMPFGWQWMYPCGGLPLTTNRTKWPIGGGAISLQPGWFTGHSTAFFYFNMGFGTNPENYSNPMLPVFQVTGPSNNAYPGRAFCMPQVPLPSNAPLANVKVGSNATIQIVEAAKHGAGLFNCVDITFVENGSPEVAEVNNITCKNDTGIGFNQVFATANLSSSAELAIRATSSWLTLIPVFVAGVLGFGMLA